MKMEKLKMMTMVEKNGEMKANSPRPSASVVQMELCERVVTEMEVQDHCGVKMILVQEEIQSIDAHGFEFCQEQQWLPPTAWHQLPLESARSHRGTNASATNLPVSPKFVVVQRSPLVVFVHSVPSPHPCPCPSSHLRLCLSEPILHLLFLQHLELFHFQHF
jgi:hypothetical protein